MAKSKPKSRRRRLIPIEDRLSALPDSILCHILSFLPTKNSAATSILSKRWNSLWLSVLALDLVANSLSDIKTFDSVILLREIKLPIRTLRLKYNVRSNIMFKRRFNVNHHWGCTDYRRPLCTQYRSVRERPVCSHYKLYRSSSVAYNPDIINPLITAAKQRGLETLQLDMVRAPLGVQLSSNIFNCKTLTVLKLRQVRIVMKHLPRINISQLKTLHLDYVKFGCNTDMINFLLLFPTLEELQTNAVDVDKFTPETEINKCLPSLITASISHTDAIPLFLLSKAHILSIKLTRTLLMQIEHSWSQVPTFHNLTQIELSLKLDSNMKLKWMLEMLQHSPNLQHLIINEKKILLETEKGDDEDNWQGPYIVPECFLSQLKTCLFRDCRGRKRELQFVEYVMRNSKVLRSMTIQSSRSIDLKVKSSVLQKLSLCPRSCKLIFD